ncbi:MAG: WG repeat-containing protein [Bacteroidetes bacterium]|nr:WG repeat-containing protein [Bacteroidota bacterium]
MKINKLLSLIFFGSLISLTACNNGTTKIAVADSSYTNEEKLEIARLAAAEEGKYDQVSDFKNGRAVVIFSDSVGILSINGDITVLPEVKELQNFYFGMAAGVTRKGEPCFVDTIGKIIKTFPDYQSVNSFSVDGYTNFFHKNGKFGLMDRNFKEIIPAKYNQTSWWEDGLFIVEKDGKWGAVDKDDKTIIPFEYTNLGMMDEKGRILARNISGQGFIDKTGKVIVPLQFSNLSNFSKNLARFQDKESSNYGLINSTGTITVKPIYFGIDEFKNDLAKVYVYLPIHHDNNVTVRGYIDSTGKEVIKAKYLEASDFSKEGFALVSDSTKTFYIDKHENIILPYLPNNNPETVELSEFENGFAKIKSVNGATYHMDRYQRILTSSDLKKLRNEYFRK